EDVTASGNQRFDLQVMDSSGCDWLNSWTKNFAALGISHLRSPMFFHPCPRDRDGLLAFARETGRCDDCIEIANCVGKSMSKHRRKKKTAKGYSVGSSSKAILEIDERDRKDYFTPSAEIFQDYCEEVVQRYSLANLVEQSQVSSIDFGYYDDFDLYGIADPGTKIFKVITTNGAIKFAKIVVLAIGAGGKPAMPRQLSAAEKDGACHSTQLSKQMFLAEHVTDRILARVPTAVVIIGGGLTSAQIANQCIVNGVRRVFLARNGGSITPRYFKKLQTHIARGSLSIHTHTTIKNQIWDNQRRSWDMETDPPIPNLPSRIDYIYYATGIQPNIHDLPFLSPLREKAPIEVIRGMPCLTQELAWAKDVPLFVAGRLAGLRIGPDCGNLEGARVGAERISWAVEEILEREQQRNRDEADDSYRRLCQRVGSVNMYESLVGESD
ncbi:MAG: hypothetical protein Q9186_006954, partial [Xanthomendoza sp. 1 TL-2023]